MGRTIHIKGYGKDIDLSEELGRQSFAYEWRLSKDFDSSVHNVIDNVFFRFYECPKKCDLEQAIEYSFKSLWGSLEVDCQDYGYSEFTIEGCNIYDVQLGGHDLQKVIDAHPDKYLHILMDVLDKGNIN